MAAYNLNVNPDEHC